ncbi:WxcM-like domain-containing protein [Aeromonas hydrophila]|uniref:sugar 3,4-ketoisomerase n=1 Tax=Aeromonas TaxID=642 RepID=UPI000FEBC5B4|nr:MULTISPECIES: FdtA/QdtA family cupin domain-containing protein [Aeromonas]MBM0439828.1 WxcM-like domain-containing protein [Aeromonas hydrophila subsp. ranae]MBW3830329.1 WxcM-like domain-containing protein [Aeromonas hydrophila]MBX9565842.1 WxcM-like domain-containing protein [Aeromonas hydrophila]MDK3165082.1 FdtA/QdtA family cupin domain-containing protein [Aeromonas caviae]RWT01091.1 WxcM-like domain-containing protein [Aeromonas caviae]
MLIKLLDFNILGDERGQLVAIEGNRHIPFDIKRVYYLFGTKPDIARGFHAHKALQQVAICVSGSCRFVMDDGVNKESIVLDSAVRGLFIDAMQWHEMYDFSPDCVLMVLASDVYDESDYIRDYESFIALSGKL